ncbi:MAG: hypothetical protein ABIG71_00265 [Candidatus Uhrbacteria bacterium]
MIFIGIIVAVIGIVAISFVLSGISLASDESDRPDEVTQTQQEQEHAVKERIMIERASRRFREVSDRAVRKAQTLGSGLGGSLQRGHRKLRLLAQEHAAARQGSEERVLTCDELIVKADAAVERDELEHAEEEYLACLKLDAKHRGAYLGLATLYRRRKEGGLAEETLCFLRKLYPDDGEVHYAYSDILLWREKHAEALHEILAALEKKPKNPRFLDFAVELAIVEHDAELAGELLDRLREANPDNQKLDDLERRIGEL